MVCPWKVAVSVVFPPAITCCWSSLPHPLTAALPRLLSVPECCPLPACQHAHGLTDHPPTAATAALPRLSLCSRMLSSPCTPASSRTCSRILGLSLGTAALFAAGANMALLFPNWDVTYLLRGLIGKHAMLGTGLWGGGLMVSVWGSLNANSQRDPGGGAGRWHGKCFDSLQ